MIAITELFSRVPRDLFVAVVELEATNLVGVIEDPLDLDPNNARLGYPVEYAAKLTKTGTECKCENRFVIPEFGVPEEKIIASDIISIHRGDSVIGMLYLKVLKEMTSDKPPIPQSYGFVPRSAIVAFK